MMSCLIFIFMKKTSPPISGVLPFSPHNIGKGDISIFGKGDGSDSNYSDSGGESDYECDEPSKSITKKATKKRKSHDKESDVQHASTIIDINNGDHADSLSKNVVYIAHIILSVITGHRFNAGEIATINSIDSCNKLHDTYKIGSFNSAKGAVLKIRSKSCYARFGHFKMLILEVPEGWNRYHEDLLLAYGTEHDANLNINANRVGVGEWIRYRSNYE